MAEIPGVFLLKLMSCFEIEKVHFICKHAVQSLKAKETMPQACSMATSKFSFCVTNMIGNFFVDIYLIIVNTIMRNIAKLSNVSIVPIEYDFYTLSLHTYAYSNHYQLELTELRCRDLFSIY